eukprot:TRINITY_DN18232_c0_g1_i1.p1 TRINITY_DN18232_c0_g1~~TRINITY_DN18232_c0_g1_i1.p1  ORF type:complete len:217 (-),score=36.27 TRINITY_DN18232_c0_g1_i1:24-674(-)
MRRRQAFCLFSCFRLVTARRFYAARPRKGVKVILTDHTLPLGYKGEVVEVAKGYARNYLLPKKIAVRATPENIKYYEHFANDIDFETRQKAEQIQRAKRQLRRVTVEFPRHANQKGNRALHSDITKEEIIIKLWQQHKIELAEEEVNLPKPIEAFGEFRVPVTYSGVTVNLSVVVRDLKKVSTGGDDETDLKFIKDLEEELKQEEEDLAAARRQNK